MIGHPRVTSLWTRLVARSTRCDRMTVQRRRLCGERSEWLVCLFWLSQGLLACSRPKDHPRDESPDPPITTEPSTARNGPSPPTSATETSRSAPDSKELVYLVGADDTLWSFEPELPGNAAYRRVGHIQCPSARHPESMAVDRSGFAWVSYGSTNVFRVRLSDAACTPTSGIHTSQMVRTLGMGFTANAPGSTDESLYVLSPDFGLASVALPSLELTVLGPVEDGELTGGGDGKLFRFSPRGRLSEIDKKTFAQTTIHVFGSVKSRSGGYAFARYGGAFYVFTSFIGGQSSETTEFDPSTNVEHVRDADIGFKVVGAGQSTRAPMADKGARMSESFH